MIKKMAVAGIAASVLGFGFFASHSAEARSRGSWGHHSSYSSPSSHSSYSSQPHSSYAQTPHATAPMAPPAAAAKPSVLGSIATTAAGTAGGVVAGNAISHAFEGNGDGKDAKSDDKSASSQANNESSAVPVVADSSAGGAHGLPQAADPCSAENEAKNPRIEELCGQLHQELRKVNDTAKEQAAAQK